MAAHAGLDDSGGMGGGSGGEGPKLGSGAAVEQNPRTLHRLQPYFLQRALYMLPTHSFSVKNNEGTGPVISIDTTHLGLESSGWRHRTWGSEPAKASDHESEFPDGGVVNINSGFTPPILQSDGAFRMSSHVEREKGTVFTDDHVTVTPSSPNIRWGIRDMFHLSTSSWESIDIKKKRHLCPRRMPTVYFRRDLYHGG